MDYIDKDGNLVNLQAALKDDKYPDTCMIGKALEVNVEKLISEVITSPYIKNDAWITETVRSVVNEYGFDFNVKSSELLDEPAETV